LIWVIDDAVDSVFNSARIDDVETRVFVPIRFHGQQEPGSIGRDVGYIDRMDDWATVLQGEVEKHVVIVAGAESSHVLWPARWLGVHALRLGAHYTGQPHDGRNGSQQSASDHLLVHKSCLLSSAEKRSQANENAAFLHEFFHHMPDQLADLLYHFGIRCGMG